MLILLGFFGALLDTLFIANPSLSLKRGFSPTVFIVFEACGHRFHMVITVSQPFEIRFFQGWSLEGVKRMLNGSLWEALWSPWGDLGDSL